MAFHIALTKQSDDSRSNYVEHISEDILSSLDKQVETWRSVQRVYGKVDE
jgi:hypothetical protein